MFAFRLSYSWLLHFELQHTFLSVFLDWIVSLLVSSYLVIPPCMLCLCVCVECACLSRIWDSPSFVYSLESPTLIWVTLLLFLWYRPRKVFEKNLPQLSEDSNSAPLSSKCSSPSTQSPSSSGSESKFVTICSMIVRTNFLENCTAQFTKPSFNQVSLILGFEVVAKEEDVRNHSSNFHLFCYSQTHPLSQKCPQLIKMLLTSVGLTTDTFETRGWGDRPG